MNLERKKRRKRFQRDPKVSLKLTDRDRDIIHWVYRHRFLSSEHIISLVEGSGQGISRRLNRLFHSGYLDRPKRQMVAFGNNHYMVYGLGNKGANLLASEFDLPVETVDWSRKNRDAKEIFLEHTLMVSRILTTFRLACRKQKNIEFVEPDHLIKCRQKPPTIKTHALSWRVNVKKGEYSQKRFFSFNMLPDSVFGLRIKKKSVTSETYFFLEADRATMPVRRTNFYRSSFYKKMVGYVASYKNELFSEYFGFKKVRILTVTKSDERINNMIIVNKSLHNMGNGYNLFLFAKDNAIDIQTPKRIFKQIWINGRGKKDNLLQ
jgi:Replication-relaxation